MKELRFSNAQVKGVLRIVGKILYFKYNESSMAKQAIKAMEDKGAIIEKSKDGSWIKVDIFKDNEFAKKTYNSTTDKEFKHGFLSSRHQGSVPRRTREPYPLPKLILDDWYSTQGDPSNTPKDISEFLKNIHVSHIRIENYQSHPHIKAPLSN